MNPLGVCFVIFYVYTIFYGYIFMKIMYEVGKWLPVIVGRKISECENYFAISILQKSFRQKIHVSRENSWLWCME